MTQPKFTKVLKSQADFIEFLKTQFAKDMLEFSYVASSEEFIIFKGTALVEQEAKPFFKNDTPKKVQDDVGFIVMFGNLECLVRFDSTEYVDLPKNITITTPYVKFLARKLKTASTTDSSFADLRQELIALHNAKVKDNYTKSIQQAKLDYVDNMIDL